MGVFGPEIRLREMIRTWDDADVMPIVFYPEDGRLLADFREAMGRGICKVITYPPIKSGFKYLKEIYRLSKTERPDIIHSQGPTGIDLCSFLVGTLTRTKVLVSRASMISDDVRISAGRRILLRLYDFFFVRWADMLVAVSCRGMEIWEKELLYIPVRKKQIVYNGIDLSMFCPISFPNQEGVVFGVIAQLNTGKGHTLLFEAVQRIKSKRYNFKLMVVGDGPLAGELKKLANDLAIEDTVQFTGHVDRVEDVIAKMHIVVLPSLKEGFPVSLIEAMACGRPVIATDVGAVSEILRNGENGFLIVPADSSAISSAMAKFIDEPNLIREMGHRAFISAQQYSLESMRDGYVKLYKDMLLSVSAPNALGKK